MGAGGGEISCGIDRYYIVDQIVIYLIFPKTTAEVASPIDNLSCCSPFVTTSHCRYWLCTHWLLIKASRFRDPSRLVRDVCWELKLFKLSWLLSWLLQASSGSVVKMVVSSVEIPGPLMTRLTPNLRGIFFIDIGGYMQWFV